MEIKEKVLNTKKLIVKKSQLAISKIQDKRDKIEKEIEKKRPNFNQLISNANDNLNKAGCLIRDTLCTIFGMKKEAPENQNKESVISESNSEKSPLIENRSE